MLQKICVEEKNQETLEPIPVSWCFQPVFKVLLCYNPKNCQRTIKQMSSKNDILNKAAEVFLRYGFRSVTMDDLRRELCMSKKTLYQHFANKDDLISQVLDQHQCEEQENIFHLRQLARDAVEEFLLISKMSMDTLRKVSPVVIFDLQKYHPEIWRNMLEKDFGQQLDILTANLQRGIDEGFYREDLPVDIAGRLYLAQSEGMVKEYIFPADYARIEQALLVRDNLFMRAICSPAGLERLLYYRDNGLQEVRLDLLGLEL